MNRANSSDFPEDDVIWIDLAEEQEESRGGEEGAWRHQEHDPLLPRWDAGYDGDESWDDREGLEGLGDPPQDEDWDSGKIKRYLLLGFDEKFYWVCIRVLRRTLNGSCCFFRGRGNGSQTDLF